MPEKQEDPEFTLDPISETEETETEFCPNCQAPLSPVLKTDCSKIFVCLKCGLTINIPFD